MTRSRPPSYTICCSLVRAGSYKMRDVDCATSVLECLESPSGLLLLIYERCLVREHPEA